MPVGVDRNSLSWPRDLHKSLCNKIKAWNRVPFRRERKRPTELKSRLGLKLTDNSNPNCQTVTTKLFLCFREQW